MELKNKGLSLYLHIPFCRTHCTYCDFNIYTNLSFLFDSYTKSLADEITRTMAAIAEGRYNPLAPLPLLVPETNPTRQPLEIETIFIGGGTPSLLPPMLLERILKAITRFATIKPGAEITLEANPGTLPLENLRTIKSLGINRLSYGVQTFEDAALKKLGRSHDSRVALESFELARRAGFDNLSLDFMYGLPGQTLESWGKSLEVALSLQPEHISMYGLIVEENTSLGRGVTAGKIQIPDEDNFADMYLLGLEKLAAAGFQQYEISNFAQPGFSSRHNLVYWHNESYIGLGVGAHSSYGGYRYAVLKQPQEYIKRLRQGQSVIDLTEAEPITPALKLADSVILALRLNEGLRLSRIEQEFGKSLEELYPGVVAKMLGWDLVEELDEGQDKILRLTVRGRLLSNNVFMEFLPG